jgi:hypothetical protein
MSASVAPSQLEWLGRLVINPTGVALVYLASRWEERTRL